MNQDEQIINPENFILLNKIGEGGFGEVYIVIKKEHETKYVAKISKISLTQHNEEFKLSLKREVNLLAQINHPYVVKFIGYSPIDFLHRNRPVIITEYLPNGSLYDLVKREKNNFSLESWTPTKKLINIFGIASIMSYLHKNDIIHRDLKLDNILLDDYLFPKIADFGLSKVLHKHTNSITTQSKRGIKGTIMYTAPELFNKSEKSQYSKASDVYAYAFIVYEILNPTFPYRNQRICEVINDVKNNKRPIIDKIVPKCYRKLIKKCWSHSPKHRPTFESIVNKLKTEKEFITDDINSKEYRDYIELFENCSNDHVDLSNFTKIKIGPDSYSLKYDLSKNGQFFNKLAEDTRKIFERALNERSNGQLFVISDDESLKLFATKSFDSPYFANVLNYFSDVIFELKSGNNILAPILGKLSMLFDKDSSMIKVHLFVSDCSHLSKIIGEKSVPISLKLDDEFESIPNNAFSDCKSVYEVNFGASLRTIGERSFSGCESLDEVVIPSSVIEIGIGAFEGCANLEHFEIKTNEMNEIKEIKEYTFKGCERLIEITLPRSINKIGRYAFEGCKSLNSLDKNILEGNEYIGEQITIIEEGTFKGCSSLSVIIIPTNITDIENDSFKMCTQLKNIIFETPSSLRTIKDQAFRSCTSLVEIKIPGSVKKIGSCALKGCTSLEKVSLPASVESIGSSAFEGCTKLIEVDLKSRIKILEEKTFKGCISLQRIEIPSSVQELCKETFCLCSSLENISLPHKLKRIGTRTFASCISLSELKIPNNVETIGDNAFNLCASLKIYRHGE
ncbi:hypothetical protein M9Y10_019541 [Tritrichomonas musculus]|uniref:Protein kinase domain-containing protein n=1 Tax=Tritrichomonas musculus TaxID=1915356 RepID=A0ABR2HGK6_9EUKA